MTSERYAFIGHTHNTLVHRQKSAIAFRPNQTHSIFAISKRRRRPHAYRSNVYISLRLVFFLSSFFFCFLRFKNGYGPAEWIKFRESRFGDRRTQWICCALHQSFEIVKNVSLSPCRCTILCVTMFAESERAR